jgi:hypothetical protein
MTVAGSKYLSIERIGSRRMLDASLDPARGVTELPVGWGQPPVDFQK